MENINLMAKKLQKLKLPADFIVFKGHFDAVACFIDVLMNPVCFNNLYYFLHMAKQK